MSACCYLCRAQKTEVSLCTDCQLKISRLERDLAGARRELAWVRKENVNLKRAVRRRVKG